MSRRKNKRKVPIFKIVVCILSLSIVVSLIQLQIEMSARKQELTEIDKKIADQEQENKELRRLLALGDDITYIERFARERLGFAYPDERIYIDMAGS